MTEQEINNYFKEFFCKCGCGICCRADDPKGSQKIDEWKKKHKCTNPHPLTLRG